MPHGGDRPDAQGPMPEAVLRADLAALADRGEAALLVTSDGTLAWATPEGAALLGARNAGEVDAARLPVARLAELAATAPMAGMRLERLRIVVGRRVEVLTLACRRVALSSGDSLLLAVAMGRRPILVGRPARPPVDMPAFLAGPAEAAEPPEQSGAAATPAPEPVSIESLRARAGRPAIRVLWSTDAQGRFLKVSPEMDELLGPGCGPAAGEMLEATLTRGLRDEDGQLAAALAGRETFTGVTLLCSVPGADAFLPLVMSGVPGFDSARRFEGFRGFGVCRLETLEYRAPIEPMDRDGSAPVAPAATPDEPAAPSAALSAAPAGSVPDAPRPGSVIPFTPMQGAAQGQLASTNVVRLKPATRPAPGQPGLSRSERHAFREIARALGARVEGDETDETAPESAAPPPRAEDQSAPTAPSGPTEPVANAPSQEGSEGPLSTPDVVGGEPAADEELLAEAPTTTPETEPPADDGAAAAAFEVARNAETVFDRLPIGILVSRGDVPIIVNRTLLDLTGYPDIDAFHADGGMPNLFRHAAHGPGHEGGTFAIAARDGEMLPVEVRLQTVQWSGLPATLVSFRRALDPEGERRIRALEAALARREREAHELKAIMDTATDGVIVVDADGRILSVNRSCEALFGYDQAEIEGEPFITLFSPDSHATAQDYLEGLRENGVASVLNDGREVVGRVRQGGRIPLFMTLGAIGEAPERKFCAVLRDITSWKKAEIDLTDAKRAAEAASAQKSDFLAKISHEIRTPLSAIIGFAEVMIEERFGPIGNERYLEYLRDIHSSGGHVISLVNDLLDLSKIEAGRFDLTFTSVDVNEIVTRAVALMQPQAGAGRIVVRTALAVRLPRVVADERSLRQIVLNLLSNGIKFTDPGGQVIVSTALTDAGEVAVRIRDTGIGMTEKEIETALEPFRQIATARRAGGTGLGLPLTKALVEANRASLSIRSARDAGTLVEVTFPTTRVLAE